MLDLKYENVRYIYKQLKYIITCHPNAIDKAHHNTHNNEKSLGTSIIEYVHGTTL